MKTTNLFLALLALVLAVPALQPAFAQGENIEEIVVTARKREESLADVPLSISVFTAEEIKQRGMVTISDVAQATPGVSWTSYEAEGRGDSPSIRGMSTNTGDPTLQNARVFVDGVFISGSLFSTLLSDIERVEVIKGPQNALFGRATFAGAINYITRRPSNEFEGAIDLTAADHGETMVTGRIAGPIIEDTLLFKLNAANIQLWR